MQLKLAGLIISNAKASSSCLSAQKTISKKPTAFSRVRIMLVRIFEDKIMALSRNFRESVLERANRDEAFRKALLEEALTALLEGDAVASRECLKVVVNATIGFKALEQSTNTSDKSLQRMLGPKGNPSLDKLALILKVLQKSLNLQPEVTLKTAIH